MSPAIGQSRNLAQEMAYCLRQSGVIALAGKRDRAILCAQRMN